MITRFTIMGAPRTGSSHLVGLLNNHPRIHSHAELFHPKQVQLFTGKRDWLEHGQLTQEALLEMREKDPFKFLEFAMAVRNSKPIVGFKIFLNHNDDILQLLINDYDVKIIILYRQNFLAVYSSTMIADIEQVWGVDARAEQPLDAPRPKIDFNESDFYKQYKRYQSHFWRITSELNQAGREFLFVNYEDINNIHLTNRIVTFLGALGAIPEHVKFRKQNSSNLLDRFKDPEIVLEYLTRTKKLQWLHEGESNFRYE
jgi:LPS sulfotransferase NodH